MSDANLVRKETRMKGKPMTGLHMPPGTRRPGYDTPRGSGLKEEQEPWKTPLA